MIRPMLAATCLKGRQPIFHGMMQGKSSLLRETQEGKEKVILFQTDFDKLKTRLPKASGKCRTEVPVEQRAFFPRIGGKQMPTSFFLFFFPIYILLYDLEFVSMSKKFLHGWLARDSHISYVWFVMINS